MKKRNYTHVQVLLPEIKAMLDAGKTQREVAEYFGLQNKYVVKQLLIRCATTISFLSPLSLLSFI